MCGNLSVVRKILNLGNEFYEASCENGLLASSKLTASEEDIDLSHLQLPEMDDIGAFGDPTGQGQDLASWLNFGEDCPDGNFTGELGLPIPMDDLSAEIVKCLLHIYFLMTE